MKLLIPFLATVSCLYAAVDGTIINGTTGKPQAGVAITLIQPSQTGMQTLAEVKSGADGKFSAEARLPPGPVLVQATYQGVAYNMMITPGSPTNNLTVNVFDATKNEASGKIGQHLLLFEPGADALHVTETFLSQNDTKQTFDDSAKGSIRFFVPEAGRDNVTITVEAPGGMPIQRPAEATKTPGIYKASYPLKPGETRFDVKYSLPAAAAFTGENADTSAPINLVTPASVTLSGDGIQDKGQEPQSGAHIYLATAPSFTVQLTGTGSIGGNDSNSSAGGEDNGQEPIEVQPARIYTKMYWVLGLTLGILALGGVALYRKGTA